MRVKQEVRISGDREVVHSERIKSLVRFKLAWGRAHRANFGETVRNEEDEEDQQSVGGALDLEVAE